MIKKILSITILINVCTSCVSKKLYSDLEGKYTNLKKEHRGLTDSVESLSKENTSLTNNLNQLQQAYNKAVKEQDQLQSDLAATKNNLDNLKASYKALEENSSVAISENSKKNRELLALLEGKEQALANESERLENLRKKLQDRSKRITDLERVIATKDANMLTLKNAISKALTNFEGKGLTVEQRNGKVYVSMENKLLFQSGSWYVGSEGRKAVQQLGGVLAENPDVAILIEGHTDNVPYKGNTQISGNWDLSTKRATAIVNILREYKTIKPENLTAAGRGEFAPIATNSTTEGKAKNRRIEVILTPKLDEISKLLGEM